jgi:putative hemolysin
VKNYKSPFLIEEPLTKYPRVKKIANAVLGLNKLDKQYRSVIPCASTNEFLDNTISELNIKSTVITNGNKIPPKGPLIIISNHPYGGPEAIALAKEITKVRPDLKILANFILGRIPEMRELLLLVDPFENDASVKKNILPIRIARKHLNANGALLIFPAGEVSSYKAKARSVVDTEWKQASAYLARVSNADVLPVYISGHNGIAFSAAGFIHPILRTILLPRCLLHKRSKQFDIKFGKIIGKKSVKNFSSDKELTELFRNRVYALRYMKAQNKELSKIIENQTQTLEPIIDAIDKNILNSEVENIPSEQILIRRNNQIVFYFNYTQGPNLMTEIGRLREVAFRAVAEGSGKNCDLDEYDKYYDHVVCWSEDNQDIIGSYRLGRVDKIVKEHGLEGLYATTLFNFDLKFLNMMGSSIELGRSFISPPYQKTAFGLSLLWKGVIAYVSLFKKYYTLFGPVSISPIYSERALALMIRYLEEHRFDQMRAKHISGKNPIQNKLLKNIHVNNIVENTKNFQDLSDIIEDIDTISGGAPALLKEYIKLNGRFLAFNVDPQFQNSIDSLIRVDVRDMNFTTLKFLFGKEALEHFMHYHKDNWDTRQVA